MEYVLKRILPSGVGAALQKADKYRELGQPTEAESICRDVLAVDPGNQAAWRNLGLALSDQFGALRGGQFAEAERIFARLEDPYARAFYSGLVCERQAKAQLTAHTPLHSVRPLFEHALAYYAEAEAIRPPGNDDPILRWNSCVRALQAAQGPASAEREDRPEEWESDTVPHQR